MVEKETPLVTPRDSKKPVLAPVMSIPQSLHRFRGRFWRSNVIFNFPQAGKGTVMSISTSPKPVLGQ